MASTGLNGFRGVFVILIAFAWLWLPACGQEVQTPLVHTPLNADEVIQKLVEMDSMRSRALHSYEGDRTYAVSYHGIGGARSASMVVHLKYTAPNSKEFVVQSVTGSALLVGKVLKKLLKAEKQAASPAMQRRSALTKENYVFSLVGYERGSSSANYVFQVQPRRKDQFLYRGRVWVDAQRFAVVRLEAEPAKHPSFWTKDARIVEVYERVGDFWLPASLHSLSGIRLGGHADLTINYKNYKITNASPVSPR